jgi:pimeloyl-ACP methyl ester carboxylesterase
MICPACDSGWRAQYNPELRSEEIRAVIAVAQLGERPFIIGHSFGGFMTMKVASRYGDTLGGAVIVDSPIRSPEEEILDVPSDEIGVSLILRECKYLQAL